MPFEIRAQVNVQKTESRLDAIGVFLIQNL